MADPDRSRDEGPPGEEGLSELWPGEPASPSPSTPPSASTPAPPSASTAPSTPAPPSGRAPAAAAPSLANAVEDLFGGSSASPASAEGGSGTATPPAAEAASDGESAPQSPAAPEPASAAESASAREAPSASEGRLDVPDAQDRPAPTGVSTEDLRRALSGFISASPDERTSHAVRVRLHAEMLEEAGEVEGLARAIERTLLARAGDGGARELACQLVTDEVARVLTYRLVDACADEAKGRRLAALYGRLNPEMADAVARVLATNDDPIVRRVLTEALVALAPESQELVAQFLMDANREVVSDTVTVIGRTGIPNAVQFLMTALAHDDPGVRTEALIALGRVGGPEAGLLARSYLDVADRGVRAAAVEALGKLGDDASVPKLVERLEAESDTEVQVSVLLALGRIGNEAALPSLLKRATSSRFSRGSRQLRRAAVQALAGLDHDDAWACLEELVDDRDAEVRDLAVYHLRSR